MPETTETRARINSLADVVHALMAKEWNVPIDEPQEGAALNTSNSMVVPPRSSELDDVVMIIYLAVDRGMNPAVWLEPEEEDVDGLGQRQTGPKGSGGEDDLLLMSEFFDRMQSLKLVLRSWEFKSSLVGGSVMSSGDDDPDASDLTQSDKELIRDMFGVEGDSRDVKSANSSSGYIDVKSFLFHCYERMEDVELKFQAQQVQYEQALLDDSFDDTAIRSSLDELKQARQARQRERDQETTRMNEFIEQQKRTGDILLSPDAVVTNTSLPHSPYDEEVAFDLDSDDGMDSIDGMAKLKRGREGKQHEQGRKMAQLSEGSGHSNIRRGASTGAGARAGPTKKREVLNTGTGAGADAHKTEDRAAWRRELSDILGDDDKAVQLDVVEDLLRKVVRQSNLFIAVEKRFGFVEPSGGADSHVGPARTKLLTGFRSRLSEEDVREGFLAAHLVLTKAQVKLLFLLVVKHAKCRLRKCGFLPRNQEEAMGGKTGGGTATILKSDSAYQGAAHPSSFHGRDINAGGPRPSSAPTSPTRTKPLAYSPSSITINSAVTGSGGTKVSAASGGSGAGGDGVGGTRNGTASDHSSPGSSSVGSRASTVTTTSVSNLRQSLQAAANTMPIVSREKAVLRGKLSAAWLWDYLRLLRLTRKTVPTAAALEILRGQSQSAASAANSSSAPSAEEEGDGLGPRGSKMAAAAAIASAVGSGDGGEEGDEEEEDDSDYEGGDDDQSEEDEYGQLPMPRAMRRALAGKYYYIADHQLDNIVGGYARSAALHGDGSGKHRGVVVSQAYLDKEILMRVQRWVGNVDASNDFQHKLRTALRQHGKLYKSQQTSAALSFEELRLQQQQVRQMLVDEKAEELRSEERLHGSVTKELFWKYLSYCKEAMFRDVCTFSAWLDWRHSNFSSTHREVQSYRTRAGARLRESLQKERLRSKSADAGVGSAARGAGAGGGEVPGKGKGGGVAFGGTTAIGRFGNRDAPVPRKVRPNNHGGSSLYAANPEPDPVMDVAAESGEAAAMRMEVALERAEEERKRAANHALWRRRKVKEREATEAEQRLKQRKETKDKRRRKKAAEAEFKTWLKLRSYNKFAVKDRETGAILAIRDHPFNADNASVRVRHEKEWQSYVGPRPPKVVARVTKKNTAAVDGAQDYTVLVKVDVEKEEREREEREKGKESAAVGRRKASVPKQASVSKKKKKGKKVKRGGVAAAGILDISVSSI